MALSLASLFSVSSSSASQWPNKPSPTTRLQLLGSISRTSLRCGSVFLSNPPAHGVRQFLLFSAAQPLTVEDDTEKEVEGETQKKIQENDVRRKLFVVNLPFSFSAPDIRNLFGQCGTVEDVEIIKNNGKHKGFAFITMASAEEARAVVEKLDAFEVKDRIIRIEFAKSMKRPSRAPAGPPSDETRHKIYVSNLAWKARSSHLRELFSASFNPVSCRVVFDTPTGRSAGYGFVSFGTQEEAEAAISALDGKELMGRPLRLKMSQKQAEETEHQPEAEDVSQEESNLS